MLHKLRPLFDYIPGDISPPQAPKHATNKPKLPKPGQLIKKPSESGHTYIVMTIDAATETKARPSASQLSEDFDEVSAQFNDEESIENSSVYSASFIQDRETPYYTHQISGRKRKRAPEAQVVDQHQTLYADTLLDYFMLSSSGSAPLSLEPPEPPADYEVDRPIDDLGHTALHWATAMGDIAVVKAFLDLNADSASRNARGETPLIRAVIFTNNYDKGTMGQIVDLLKDTLCIQDKYGCSVLHHVAATTNSHSRKRAARHYLEVLLHRFCQVLPPQQFAEFLNARDHQGDTALHIVARNLAKKCIRTLLGRGAITDIPNNHGETADQYIQRFASQHQEEFALVSSSPVQSGTALANGHAPNGAAASGPSPYFGTEAARSFSESFGTLASGKGLQIAIAIDAEMKDKETDLEEAHRLLANVENERSAARAKTYALLSSGGLQDGSDDAELEELQREYDALKAISESYLEQQQHKELHAAVREEDSRLPPSAHHAQVNGASLGEIALQERLNLAWDLAAEQEKRQQLVKTVVEAQATAGMSDKGERLKTLIATIIGIPEDEVVGLVPELLEELELSKMDGINGRMEPATFAIS